LNNNSKHIAEADLIYQLKAHNEAAFNYLYNNYSKALYAVIYQILQQQDLSEDVLQEAFIKIWKNVLQYDATKGTLFTWMLNICRNQAIDKTRSKIYKNNLQNQSIENNVSVFNQIDNAFKPEHIGLQKLKDSLDPKYREIIDLIYYKGYTQQDAAEHLLLPLGTVKTRCRAALLELKKVFNN
jgi:RNA polymerase sigma-70 factor (ECF subfamily)